MYSCRVFLFLFWLLSATVVTDNHPFIIVYIDTVSPVREQFFRLAQTSIGILQYLLSKSSSQYMLAFRILLEIVILAILLLRILLLRF